MAETNSTSRLEAFCDGVFAIALTLLIIDIKLPPSVRVDTTDDLWRALKHLLPSVFAFIVSFMIILITWVNHHGSLKLVRHSSASFLFANGLLLLSVVFIPFPTALVGDFLFTDHASPAVVLYVSTMVLQALGWIVVTRTALTNDLAKDEKSQLAILGLRRNGYFAFALYSLCAVMALWFPLAIAIITTAIWIYWLALGISMKHA